MSQSQRQSRNGPARSVRIAVVVILGLGLGAVMALNRGDPERQAVDAGGAEAAQDDAGRESDADPRGATAASGELIRDEAAQLPGPGEARIPDWIVQVSDPVGAPLPGASLATPAGRVLGRSDDRGRLVIAGDEPSVAITLAPWVPATVARPDSAARDRTVAVRLQQGLTLRGRVVDQDGRSLAGVLVEAAVGIDRFGERHELDANAPQGPFYRHVHGLGPHRSYTASAVSNAQGKFSLPGIAAEPVCVQASVRGYLLANVMSSALLDGAAMDLRGGTEPGPLQLTMRRLYLGVVAVHAPPGTRPGLLENFASVRLSAPSGLVPLGFSQRRSQVRAVLQDMEREADIWFDAAYLADLGSAISSQVLARWTVRTPTGAEKVPVALVPLDQFDSSCVVHHEVSRLPETVEVRVDTDEPVELVGAPDSPVAGARFRPVEATAELQVFAVRPGSYFCRPLGGLLVNMVDRVEIFDVQHATTWKPTRLAGMSKLHVIVTDHLDRPAEDYSVRILGASGELIFSGEGGWTRQFPCEPGAYEITVRDRGMTKVARRRVTCVAGEATVARIAGG